MLRQSKHIEAQNSILTLSGSIYEIYERVLWIIKEYCNRLKIHNTLYVIGSVAKGELSCIRLCTSEDGCFFKISDLDLLIFTDTFSYVKCTILRCDRYIEEIEKACFRRNIKLDISFALLPLWIYRVGLFKVNSIDLYELAPVLCFEGKRVCKVLQKNRLITITNIDKYDLLNLALSSFIDFLSVYLDSERELENNDIYTLSKRILTLLYCAELYLGLKPRSYIEASLIAVANVESLKNIVDKDDIELLNYIVKVKSDVECRELHEVQLLRKENLVALYKKLLRRFLKLFFDNSDDSVSKLTFVKKEYLIPRGKLLALLFFYVGLYMIEKLVHEDTSRLRDELIIMIRYKMRLHDFLRMLALKYAILLLFDECLVIKNPNFRKAGLELVRLWYKYMVL